MNINVSPVRSLERCQYDFALASIGYESRARHGFHTSEIDVDVKTALVFATQQELDFESNREFFKASGFLESEASVGGVRDWIAQVRRKVQSRPTQAVSVIVDISSMTRQIMAQVCFELSRLVE